MIDIHTHVLPGVDDGARDLATAVAMCRASLAGGVETIVATPHQGHELWQLPERSVLVRLRDELQRALGPRPRIVLGAEIAVGSELLADLDRYPECEWLPLAGSRYLLLEFGPVSPRVFPHPVELVHELRLAGWFPILAHPERIPGIADDKDLLARLRDAGALFQLTAGSFDGQHGARPRAWARAMLAEGFADFVASDTHDTKRRPPGLADGFDAVRRLAGEAAAIRLTRDNPGAILANAPLARRRGWQPTTARMKVER